MIGQLPDILTSDWWQGVAVRGPHLPHEVPPGGGVRQEVLRLGALPAPRGGEGQGPERYR